MRPFCAGYVAHAGLADSRAKAAIVVVATNRFLLDTNERFMDVSSTFLESGYLFVQCDHCSAALVGRWTPARQLSTFFDFMNTAAVLLVPDDGPLVTAQLIGAELGNGQRQYLRGGVRIGLYHENAGRIWRLPLE